MSILSNNKELLNQLIEKTKENIKILVQNGKIFKDEEFQKAYSINNEVQYTYNSLKKPIPINIIYHSLYDQETKCQTSNGKMNLTMYQLSLKNDYDIKFDKKTLNNNSAPKFFKIPIEKSVKLFIESNNSIKKYIDDLNNYPKIFEFQYNYQHPVPNPTFMGTKLFTNTDSYKIIFVSPICLIIEIKGESTGYRGIDSFYSAIRHKFNMELNNDLTLQKTIYNNYFGINFTKSTWIKGKIISSAMEQSDIGFNGVYLPLITKELNLIIKKFLEASSKKTVSFKDKVNNSGDTSMIYDDLIINDSFISYIEDDFNNKKNTINNNDNNIINNKFQNDNINSKDMLHNNIIYFVIVLGMILIYKFFGKDYLIIILLSLVIYYLFLINNKLDKLCLSKNI